LGFDTFLLVDLLGTIWHDKEESRQLRKQERSQLLSRIYGVHINRAERAISYLEEVIRRYKRHFKVPSPEHQLTAVLSFLDITTSEIPTIYPLWFETLIEYPPAIDYAFLSALEKLKREKNIVIGAYVGMDCEAEKYIRELLSISGFLHIFDSILVSSSMAFIPPSPLAFSHVPPPGMFDKTIGISSGEQTLKSMVLAGYKHIYKWQADKEDSIFDTMKDYGEIITKISIL
jgi:FMN phosphatase YigB (HAD superfamily)